IVPSRCVDMREWLPTHPSKVYYSRSLGELTHIVVHHSGPAPLDMTAEQAAICTATYDIAPHGPNLEEWPGCSYHVIIVPSGDWGYCQSLTVISYHVGNYNRGAVGVCLWGDYRTTPVPDVMVDSLEEFCRWVQHERHVWADDVGAATRRLQVVGHRELTATTCPGDYGMLAVAEVNRRLVLL
ncbi:MAG: peptidoglycan recognition family protein, partial [Gammaproteobacteria bacterium]|nr:peptidoglycan recognition family protein [Gammaproteobacteria bacterium]